MMKARTPAKKPKKGGFQLAPQTDHGGAAARWRIQRLLEILAVVVIVAMMTREPKRPPLVADDIDRVPVASEEIRAALSFESEDIEATRPRPREGHFRSARHLPRQNARVAEQLDVLDTQIKVLSEQRGVVQQAVSDALLASTEAESSDATARKAVTELATKLKSRPEWKDLPDRGCVERLAHACRDAAGVTCPT
jgi:hypothetical protein